MENGIPNWAVMFGLVCVVGGYTPFAKAVLMTLILSRPSAKMATLVYRRG
jgi:hypothetical protein